jgi:hypothetical protein
MHEEYQRLIEKAGGVVMKTERKDTRNRLGEFGWVGSETGFILDGVAWQYRTGFVYPKRNHGVTYNKVLSYDDDVSPKFKPEPGFVSFESTEFFSKLI